MTETEEKEEMTFASKAEGKSEVEKALEALTKEYNERENMSSVTGAIVNNRGQTLKLYAAANWNGYFFSSPPGSFNPGEIAQFSHNGSRGALVYGQEQYSPYAIGYLLAWSMGNRFGRRVYVKCGLLSEVHCNGWETAALTALESSGDNSIATDDQTSSRVQAVNKEATISFSLGGVSAILT